MKRIIIAALALALILCACAEEGVGTLPEGATIEAPGIQAAGGAETAVYTVTVVDQNGDPVPQVCVTFCTDLTCDIAFSDDAGVITYEGAARAYHVSVLKLPEGYSYEATDEIYTEDHSGSLTLTVNRDA